MILFTEVRKRFGRRGAEALRGVSLSVAAGESVAVAGPNGAGKSTLLALALGFLHPTNGSVTIDGSAPRAFLRRQGAGWLPEQFNLPGTWKVRPALEHFARLDGHGSEAKRQAGSALDHFDLGLHAGHRASELSHGLGRRLALAIATLTPRRLIVFDEPTEGLDADGRERFRERCEWLRGHGSTLILASQDTGSVGQVTDRVVVLENGVVRDIVSLRAGTGHRAYRIELDRVFDGIEAFFPGAAADPPGIAFRVRVEDPAEFSVRLQSLLEAGAIVASVYPADPGAAAPEAAAGDDEADRK